MVGTVPIHLVGGEEKGVREGGTDTRERTILLGAPPPRRKGKREGGKRCHHSR